MSFWTRRVAPILKLLDGAPDAIPSTRSIFAFDGAAGSAGAYTASVHTDKEWGGRSRATFRVGNPGASGSPLCGVFEGVIDKSSSSVEIAGAGAGRYGFAMLQLKRTDEAMTDCADYDALMLRARSDGRTYALSLRNSVPLAPNLAYQGFLTAEREDGWRDFELPFTSFLATRGGRELGQPRVLDVARFGSISIAVADDHDGPFRIELGAIDAVRDPGQL